MSFRLTMPHLRGTILRLLFAGSGVGLVLAGVKLVGLYMQLKKGNFVFEQHGRFSLVRRTLIEAFVRATILAGEVAMAIHSPRLGWEMIRVLVLGRVPLMRNLRYGAGPRHHVDVFPAPAGSLGLGTGRSGGAGMTPSAGRTCLAPVVVFVHGGAWSWGHKVHYSVFCASLADMGITVVNVNYSVYPRGDVDDMIHDVQLATKWTLANVRAFGGDPDRVFLMGHSAGSHLCAAALIRAAERTNTDVSTAAMRHVKGFVGLSGVYDIDDHFRYEAGRSVAGFDGVAHISPMAPSMACPRPHARGATPTRGVSPAAVPSCADGAATEPAPKASTSPSQKRHGNGSGLAALVAADYPEPPPVGTFARQSPTKLVARWRRQGRGQPLPSSRLGHTVTTADHANHDDEPVAASSPPDIMPWHDDRTSVVRGSDRAGAPPCHPRFNKLHLPPMLLIHGDADMVVPFSSSSKFHDTLVEAGLPSRLEVLPRATHAGVLMDLMLRRGDYGHLRAMLREVVGAGRASFAPVTARMSRPRDWGRDGPSRMSASEEWSTDIPLRTGSGSGSGSGSGTNSNINTVRVGEFNGDAGAPLHPHRTVSPGELGVVALDTPRPTACGHAASSGRREVDLMDVGLAVASTDTLSQTTLAQLRQRGPHVAGVAVVVSG